MSLHLPRIFESFLGDSRKHNTSSGQISFDCPACSMSKGLPEGDGKGNLEVNYNRGVFKCWSCADTNHMKGRLPYLIKRYGNDKHLKEYFIFKPEDFNYESNGHIEIDVKLPKEFQPLVTCSSKHSDYGWASRYLVSRNIGKNIIKKFGVGYCPTGEYSGRIIIPSYDKNKRLTYFIARTFDPRGWPKYKNPEAEKQEIIFNEGLLNLNTTVYLVEGVYDHIVIPNSTPLLGKFISPKLKHLLINDAKANVVILLDADALEDAINLYRELNVGDLYGRVRICVPPNEHDPSSIYEKYGYKGIFKLLKTAYKIQESEIY